MNAFLNALDNTFLIVVITVQILTYFWFITFGLVVFCLCLFSGQYSVRQTFLNQLLKFLPFLLTLSIIFCGGFLRASSSVDQVYPWAANLIYLLLFLHIPASGLAIWKSKGQRGFTIALSMLQLWLALCSSFASFMSVTNVWL